MVRFPKSFREDLANILSMNLINLEGRPIPFSSVARLEQGAGLGSITRIDRKRTVTVSAEVEGDTPAPEVLKKVQKVMEGYELPPGYTVSYTGENEEQEEAQAFLIKAFVVALFLIALVLVTQFNSVVQPFIIMTSIILSLAGVFLGLWLFRMPFGVIMTGIGCISLGGVVVNNAIVLIDFINQLRKGGMPTEEAIVQAGMIRFRPVMLTAITTILGLVPMAIGVSFDFRSFFTSVWRFLENLVLRQGATEPVGSWWIIGSSSSQWWGSMAVAVIFGLAFATVLTLVVVPTLYSLAASLESFLSGGQKENEPETEPPSSAAA
jgi:multidrug efflux pump subunit AcrB